ncbi:stimulated by retinoic acid gene 6 protein-like isoform X2 [Sceloporus undulatus]|uniref:stimulated by retinoic acid gene 6 protein-like isoform X2 n=1 Tax=Sceloporus undulatus TaxID=8520 RepID=UPI001C4D97A0|nr:stimulated by retinoic acid gene 6 protein-like isoform X2 [Sceloporus undulatus]
MGNETAKGIEEDYGYDGDNDTDRNNTCNNFLETEVFLYYSLIPSAFIILVLTCLERRARRCCFDEKCPGLSGYIGVLTPFDSLSVYSNRWSLGFAFGVTANKVLFLFDKEYIPDELPRWAIVFWVILMAIVVGLAMYPFFVCLATRQPIAGAILGFLYTTAWLTITILDILQCPELDTIRGYNNIILIWPSLLCYLFLLGRFAFIFVKAVRDLLGLESIREEISFLEDHQAQHVHRLLRKPPLQQTQKSWIRRRLYEWDPHFLFPSRIISTVVLVAICLYMFITSEFITLNPIFEEINKDFTSDGLISDDKTPPLLYYFQEFLSTLGGVWRVSLFLSSFTCFSYIFHLLVCYRRQIKLLRAGKRLHFLSIDFKVSPSHSVVSLGKFTSWQVAYIIWGYLVMHFVLIVFGMVIMYIAILPMKEGRWHELLDKWGTVILSIVIVMVIKKLQVILAGIFFLQPKISPKDKQKPLALDNRRAFINFSYFLFFHSVVVGVTSCLMRLLYSIIIGTWLIGRVDRPVMPRGFETRDNGFNTWVQMLFLDHYHTNPILVCFCHILDTGNKERQHWKSSPNYSITELTETGSKARGRARTRWLLFYTLLNNPSLQKFRKPRSDPHSMDSPQNCVAR